MLVLAGLKVMGDLEQQQNVSPIWCLSSLV
jgi:hypothetical protein